MSSLQEQMMKAGLVDNKKAKQIVKEKRKAKKQLPKGSQSEVDEAKEAALRVREEQASRDRELNQQREATAERKAINAQIKQLIETNRQPPGARGEDEVGYNFTDGKKIKKLYVSGLIQSQLSRGQLAIVKQGDGYELVPAIVADKIAQRDESRIVSQQAVQETVEEDDPYADYQIPDDLMW
jgi:uncharacterized protein YaiL (DUF2058 family)